MRDVSRYPWPSIVATLAVAAVVYALALVYSGERVAQIQREALALQRDRLSQTSLRLEDYVGVAVQLTRVATEELGRERKRDDLARDLDRLLDSSDRKLVYGIGVFFEPFAFEPGARRFGEYRFAADAAHDVLQFVSDRSDYYYAPRPWYIAAVKGGGAVAFTGPYTSSHGYTFLGASEAFYANGKIAGAVLIEALQGALDRMVSLSRSPTDLVWVTDARGKVILGAAPISTTPFDSTVTAPLRLAPWTVHLASEFPAVASARRFNLTAGILGSIIYWLLVGVLVFALVRVRRLQMQAVDLKETASRDALTGLRNRTYVMERLERGLANRGTGEAPPSAVLFIDLDRFAVVNDSLGHSVGDELLCAIARRLEEACPPDAELGRIGGDEFVACLRGDTDSDAAQTCASTIIERLSVPLTVGDREIYIGASVGIVADTSRYKSADEILRDADTAMYAAKHAGRGRFAIFDEPMHDEVLARLSMESELRRGIGNGEVFARYQPIVHLRTGRIYSVEALARWTDATGRETPADVFVPLAERSGTIDRIDSLVLLEACRDLKRLQAAAPGLTMSVNVSATRLNQSDFVAKIAGALGDNSLDAGSLKIELTETAIMEHAEAGIAVLERLRALGAQIVIDDFGTGHSSLSYVQRLPVNGLKIDRSFVVAMDTDRQSLAIVRAIVALAKTLGLAVTAEGIEREEQANKLLDLGVEYGQGYLYSRAVDVAGVEEFVFGRNLDAEASTLRS